MNETISLLLKGGEQHEITSLHIRLLQQAYPKLSVIDEVREMARWCISNPGKRKTKRGIDKFIDNWLRKSAQSLRRQKPGAMAQSHRRFEDTDLRTSPEDKRRAEQQLAYYQKLINDRKAGRIT